MTGHPRLYGQVSPSLWEIMEIANTCSRNAMAPSQPTWAGATTMKLPQIAAALTSSEDLQPPQTAAAVKEKRLVTKVELFIH